MKKVEFKDYKKTIPQKEMLCIAKKGQKLILTSLFISNNVKWQNE
jgi:hypothetical protein